jgi:hypothetical protein
LKDWVKSDSLFPNSLLEVGMELTLGYFGDRRLEKGGPIFWAVWSKLAVARFGFAGLAAIARARFGYRDFCAILR